MNLEELGNYIEAGFWSVIGTGFLIAASSRRVARRDTIIAGIFFLAFGGSDYVEAHTGAWWRPWWLFVWKAACVLAFVVLLVRHARRKRAVTRCEDPTP